MSHLPNPSEPSQVNFPWKAAIRTFFQTFISVAAILAVAAPMLQEFVEQFWPGSPVVAWIGVGATFVAALAALLSRIMAIPGVNDLLTKIGLGAEPKS